jgi:hypothetical protein
MNNTMTIAGIIVAVTGAIIGVQQIIIPMWKKVHSLFDTWGKFIRDWEGEEAEAGRDAVPGVMARLNKLDGELSNNGGKSVKDKVDKLAKNQDLIFKKIDAAETQRAEMHEVVLEAIRSISSTKETKIRKTKDAGAAA